MTAITGRIPTIDRVYDEVKVGDTVEVITDGCFRDNGAEECLDGVIGIVSGMRETSSKVVTIMVDSEKYDLGECKYDLFRKFGDEFRILQPKQDINW